MSTLFNINNLRLTLIEEPRVVGMLNYILTKADQKDKHS